MDLTLLFLSWFVVPFLLLILLYIVSRTLFHLVLKLMSLLFLITLLVGGLSVYSVWQFGEALKQESQCYFYVADGEIRAGFLNPPLGIETSPDMVRWYTPGEDSCSEARVRVNVTRAFFSNTSFVIEQDGLRLARDDVLRVLEAADARHELARIIAQQQGVPVRVVEDALRAQYADDVLVRDMVFASALGMLLAEDPMRLVEGLRSGSVRVEPSFFFMRVLPFIPPEVFELSGEAARRVVERVNATGVTG